MNHKCFGPAALSCGFFALISLSGFQLAPLLFWGALAAIFGYLWYSQYEQEEAKKQARIKVSKQQQQFIQSCQNSSGEWLTDPDTVKKVILILQQIPVEDVGEFRRALRYKIYPLTQSWGSGHIKAGFLETDAACLQILNPNLDIEEAHQSALREFESFAQES